jgi:hypothetical protein
MSINDLLEIRWTVLKCFVAGPCHQDYQKNDSSFSNLLSEKHSLNLLKLDIGKIFARIEKILFVDKSTQDSSNS